MEKVSVKDVYNSSVLKAYQEIRSFEETAKIVTQMDAEFLEDAKGDIGVAALNRDKSPARKRAIDKCQFAIQKANMYSMFANAVAAGHK